MTVMNLSEIEIAKSDSRGVMYHCGGFEYIKRVNGSVSGDHAHPDSEEIYLLSGEIEMTVGDEVRIINAPIKISIPANVPHKVTAQTDIVLLVNRKNI